MKIRERKCRADFSWLLGAKYHLRSWVCPSGTPEFYEIRCKQALHQFEIVPRFCNPETFFQTAKHFEVGRGKRSIVIMHLGDRVCSLSS